MTQHEKTRLVHTARGHVESDTSAVNPPIVRASTVLYRDTETLKSVRLRRERGERMFAYGARGTPTTPRPAALAANEVPTLAPATRRHT